MAHSQKTTIGNNRLNLNYKDIVIAMQWTFQNNRDSQTHYHNWKIFYLVCSGVHFLDYSKLNATSIKIGEKKTIQNHNACRGRRNKKNTTTQQLSMRYREEKKKLWACFHSMKLLSMVNIYKNVNEIKNHTGEATASTTICRYFVSAFCCHCILFAVD